LSLFSHTSSHPCLETVSGGNRLLGIKDESAVRLLKLSSWGWEAAQRYNTCLNVQGLGFNLQPWELKRKKKAAKSGSLF
jgi:hypothetical protein